MEERHATPGLCPLFTTVPCKFDNTALRAMGEIFRMLDLMQPIVGRQCRKRPRPDWVQVNELTTVLVVATNMLQFIRLFSNNSESDRL